MSYYLSLSRSWRAKDTAISWQDGSCSYLALESGVCRAANLLQRDGIQAGNIIAVQMDHSVNAVLLFLGAIASGITVLPINPRATSAEVDFVLRDAKVRWACVQRPSTHRCVRVDANALNERLNAASEIHSFSALAPSTIAMLCYTSGTTGQPKGAILSHGNLLATTTALHNAWRWSADDVLIHALPLFHIHGLIVAQMGALMAGARTVWMRRFKATEALALMEHERATVFMGVPTFYHRLLSLPGRPPTLKRMRLFTSGSAPLPAQTHRAFEERFGHVILERYGMTEVGIVLSNPLSGARMPGTVGFALDRVQIRIGPKDAPVAIGAVGELHVSGPSVFSGYLNRPSPLNDGWMPTGDLARHDEEGRVTLVGRKGDLIIRGGFNIYPVEVEGALLEIEGVDEVAVFGLPDTEYGERVAAAIVSHGHPPLEETLKKRCTQVLSHYKCPTEWFMLSELPRNSMGKIEKHRLKDSFTAHTQHEKAQ